MNGAMREGGKLTATEIQILFLKEDYHFSYMGNQIPLRTE